MINIIFDLDGCLINSAEVQKAAFFGSYAEIVGDGNCPSYEEYIKYTGDSVDNVMKKMGLPSEMAAVFRRISESSVDKISIYWEAIELIKELRQLNCRIAICTGKDHYRAKAILEHYDIANLFDVLIGAEDVSEPKPFSEPILAAIDALGRSNTSVMVGDGYNDIISAKNAGIKSILTLWYGDTGVPREADYTVYTIEELRNTLLNLIK